MAKNRYINTKLWSDSFVQALETNAKLFFLYILTNEHTNIAGIYEISKHTMSFETGLTTKAITKGIKTLTESKKVFYTKEHIIICNFTKYQESKKSEKIQQGIINILTELPQKIHDSIHTLSIPYLYPTNYINTNTNLNTITPKGDKPMFEEPTIHLDGDGEEIKAPPKPKTFGKYPALIAKHYCELVGKRSAGRQLPASKELMQISLEDYPEFTQQEHFEEIKARIEIAFKYYKRNNVKEWNLSKVAENWNKLLKWK